MPTPEETFDRALDFVFDHEGGYVNDPRDPGGETKWGISKRSYPNADIENLTREQAADIYRQDFWGVLRCGALPPALALTVFDAGVNQGPRASALMLQRVLGVATDGIIGPQTVNAAQSFPVQATVRRFNVERALRYAVTANLDRFGAGWYQRLFDCHEACQELL